MLHWTSDLATGFPTIDEEHRQILAALNRLEASVHPGTSEAEVRRLLRFLDDYTHRHFLNEESVMARVRCPALHANCAAHAALRTRIEHRKNRLAEGYDVPPADRDLPQPPGLDS